MKKLIIFLFITLSFSNSIKGYYKQLKHLNQNQIEIMKFIYYNAKKDANLGYTMTAIAFKESQFGRYLINLDDPSCGVFHKLLPMYAIELGLKPNKWNESRLCEKLIESYELAYKVALNDFLKNYNYWKIKGYNNSIAWKRAIMSYNAGINGWKNGYRYYKEIVKIIKALRKLNTPL